MDEHIKKHVDILRDAVGEAPAKAFILSNVLPTFLKQHAVNPSDDLDLNPHLTILHYCKEVAEKVSEYGFTCTSEEVMLFWLTSTIYHKMFLPPFK